MLLIQFNYFEDINRCTIFKTSHQEYYLREIHESLQPGIIKALLGFHAFSGCDQTGKMCWQTRPRSPDDVFDAFGRLGSDECPSEADLTKFEKFVLNLYCKNSVPSSVTTLADLRWQMFSKKQADSDRLPPTYAALKEKVSRAHVTPLWKSAHINSPSLPDPNDCGWLFN